MKLIDKEAVVAEINRVLNSYDPNEITSGRYALVSLRDFLDTLEVKELNLSNSFDAVVYKIGNTYLKEMDKDAITKALEPYENGDKVRVIIIAQKEL